MAKGFYMQVELPYQFESPDELEMEHFNPDTTLATELHRLFFEATPANLDKSPAGKTEDIIHLIFKGAVLLKEKFPDQPFERCIETSSIWFYG